MEAFVKKPVLTIVKIGGNVVDNEQDLDQFLQCLSALEGAVILVHGGGKMATQMATRMDVPQQMIDGRRVTDEATLKIVTMVYAGYINKQITAKLQALGCNALGLCGVDGNLIQAHKRLNAAHDYGFAGDVDAVNTELIQRLLDDGVRIVVAPITHDGQGQLLNTNADTIAREIAQAMSRIYETQLIYCFEKEGVLRDVADAGSVIPILPKGDIENLIGQGIIAGGMIPKIHNAVVALERGVAKIIIGKSDLLPQLIGGSTGTTIVDV